MLHRFAPATFCLLALSLCCVAGDKDRDWKLGRVLDSTSSKTTFATGATTSTSGTSTATSNTNGTATPNGTGGANLMPPPQRTASPKQPAIPSSIT